MELTSVHVDFKATVSDGNYGNETYSVAYTATLAVGESEQSAVVHLAGLAREHVYGALKHSPREGIRYALETAEERDARYQHEREEHARLTKERAERRLALANAAASVPVPGDDDDGDDGDDDDESPF